MFISMSMPKSYKKVTIKYTFWARKGPKLSEILLFEKHKRKQEKQKKERRVCKNLAFMVIFCNPVTWIFATVVNCGMQFFTVACQVS